MSQFLVKLWDKLFSGKLFIIVSLHERSSARQTGEKTVIASMSHCVTFPMAYESEARSKQSATSISRLDDR